MEKYKIIDSLDNVREICYSLLDALDTLVRIRNEDIDSGIFLDYTIKEVRYI